MTSVTVGSIERLADPEPGELYPRLIEVAGRCPLEDCGGPWGYAAELTEWIGDHFDPNANEAEWLTAEVAALARSWCRKSANAPDAADPRSLPEGFFFTELCPARTSIIRRRLWLGVLI
jgi:hypothetical protein